MGEDRIERETEIAASLDRVWSLVTVPGFWVSDNTDLRATPDTEGQSVIVRPAEQDDFPVRVEKVQPQTYVAYRWTHSYPGEELREDNSTLVEFSLTEQAGSVRLRVVESGFSRLTGSDELRHTAFAGNSEGWGQCFEALKNRAEQPAA